MAQMTQDRRFRDAMGRFATGVTIVSTQDGEQVRAITVNGFLSVSLDPQLVLVSVRNASRMRDNIESRGRFGVSVLASDQRELSDHFAGRPRPDLQVPFVDLGGAPVVVNALAQIATTVDDAHVAGDHTLFVGKVTAFDVRDGIPLIFHGGSYRLLVEQYEWTASWKNPELQWY
jgi:flavin reductase (DIM6/NTAB) family NADH-FMN oxidoreductase RutF